ncbi:hypothetical protein OHAE_1794 [Ochrobactrum soli]|uniref:Uncharacterized protein n=1 Tax=Ochrobactrum soli TaxID=2448455 RepID=A0A2P9HP97_9HYPH|nr:hypothetical protein OHAE_1794 [[Ochrobactrum] soli]
MNDPHGRAPSWLVRCSQRSPSSPVAASRRMRSPRIGSAGAFRPVL